MIDRGKHNVLGVMVDAIDYEAAVTRIIEAAKASRPFTVTALAVHGVMTGHTDPEQKSRLNQFDLIVPDGQPVRWALNALHKTGLADRVSGPDLMLKVLEQAEHEGIGIYLYGSTVAVLDDLQRRLGDRYPALEICGAEPSKFRTLSAQEKAGVVARIRSSGAGITFVGLGCPRQEVWAHEYRDALSMPILAVGAALDFHSGHAVRGPEWMQDRGLEWLFRLKADPRRLWRRYLLLNPWYVSLVASQFLNVRKFPFKTSEIRSISHG